MSRFTEMIVWTAASLGVGLALIFGTMGLIDLTGGPSLHLVTYGSVVCVEDRDPWGNLESERICVAGYKLGTFDWPDLPAYDHVIAGGADG